jgi:hypothetical protein
MAMTRQEMKQANTTEVTQPTTTQPAQVESSRIAAAISRILLIRRTVEQNTTASAQKPDSEAAPVEWALRMMF